MNISLGNMKKYFASVLGRYHLVIFVIVVIGSLAVVVFMLNNIIVHSGEAGDYIPAGVQTSFDQDTINRVENLKTRSETTGELDISGGRVNPFVE